LDPESEKLTKKVVAKNIEIGPLSRVIFVVEAALELSFVTTCHIHNSIYCGVIALFIRLLGSEAHLFLVIHSCFFLDGIGSHFSSRQ
jgi:hypothetical protein